MRSKILKKQLIELNGERFYITGKKAMANAREIAFSDTELAILEGRSQRSEDESRSSVKDIVDRLVEISRVQPSRLFSQIEIEKLAPKICELDESEGLDILVRILLLVNGVVGMADLRVAGGSKFAGYMQPNYSKLLSDAKVDFYIIDQSVTGMFERKTRVGL